MLVPLNAPTRKSVFRLPSLGRRLSAATSCAFVLLLRVSVIVAPPLDEVCCDFQAIAWGHGKPPATKGNGHTLTYALSIGRMVAVLLSGTGTT